MDKLRLGILGAGSIAGKMASTLGRMKEACGYAVASRELGKAEAFARKYGVEKAYGSYEEMVADPDVDLVYVATPHSHHLAHAGMAIEAGKPVLCEKAFTANAREAEMLLTLAHKRGVFITEAIWTRYMPLSAKIGEILESGAIGRPVQMYASLCYNIMHKQRIVRPELAGGALLDLGVYAINFARMYFGDGVARVESSCALSDTGVDTFDNVVFYYADGRVANLQASALSDCNREGLIVGEDGYILVDNINCPEHIGVYRGRKLVEEFYAPGDQITGYEYEVLACRDAVRDGLLESPFMPHEETLYVMRQMDALRAEWGVKYPMD